MIIILLMMMMTKVKSFSAFGGQLDRQKSKDTIKHQQLLNMLHRKGVAPIKQKQSKFIQGFDRVTSREKINGFQLFHTKDCQTQANYDVKTNLVLQSNPKFSLRRQTQPRLSMLLPGQENQEHLNPKASCKKYKPSTQKQLLTTKQLQQHRKSFHSMDFQKQLSRHQSSGLIMFQKKIKQQTEIQKTKLISKSSSASHLHEKMNTERNQILKPKNIHSFASYTKRQFLDPHNLKFAPGTSGIQHFKIPAEKFKSSWKVASVPKFQNMAKTLSRYDRDSNYWFTTLQYNPKLQKNSGDGGIFFQQQTSRKTNQVNSKYPIRMAL